MTIQAGDVIVVPGYVGIKKPARILVVADDVFIGDGGLKMRVIDARTRFLRYQKINTTLGGSFWAVERDGVRIYPEAPPS